MNTEPRSLQMNDSCEGDADEKLLGLVCVEYPGVVQSPENMINSLGGRDTIAQVLEEPPSQPCHLVRQSPQNSMSSMNRQ